MPEIYFPGSPENGMGGYVVRDYSRNLAPEFEPVGQTVDFIPDPHADQRHFLPADIDAMKRHRDKIRGLDSTVTVEDARIAHQAKLDGQIIVSRTQRPWHSKHQIHRGGDE